MDSMKLFVMILTTDLVLALDCNWHTQYEYMGRCCKTCPSGQYPMQYCSNSSEIVCKECMDDSDHCFCKNMSCENRECSKCSPSRLCKRGEELRRTGRYKFGYICVPCLNQTYFNEIDKMCKPIVNCSEFGMPVLFPGNKTHNAICGNEVPIPVPGVHTGLLVGLAIIGLVCLAMMIYIFIQRIRAERMKKKYPSTSSSLKVPNDEYGCKLSKEEKGEV